MSRIIDLPIRVVADELGQPLRLLWRDDWYAVTDIIDIWREAGEWSQAEREQTFRRVAAGSGFYCPLPGAGQRACRTGRGSHEEHPAVYVAPHRLPNFCRTSTANRRKRWPAREGAGGQKRS